MCFKCTAKILDQNLKPTGVIVMISGPIGNCPNYKQRTLKAAFSISYFSTKVKISLLKIIPSQNCIPKVDA